ncbi:MAG: ankyrin repeat domain-containing protein [Bryobacterales bacterium]|nr:ankyrin repeat domain-containing protein [Bryobacterales bacterium]
MTATKLATGLANSPWRMARAVALLIAGCIVAGADTALPDAAQAGSGERVRTLLAEGRDASARQPDGTTALHWAARNVDPEIAEELLEAGADANARNRYGVTPLSLACTNGSAELVELLLASGADPNAALPGGETPLMTAARTGRLGPVRALLVAGAEPHTTVRGMGRQEGAGANYYLARLRDPTIHDFQPASDQTALVWAAAEGHAEVISELIEFGAKYRFALRSGFTPLLLAVRGGHIEAVTVLLDAGADVNERIVPEVDWRHPGYDAKLRPDGTPLHVAVENGHFELAAYLLERGADPKAADSGGYTALHAVAAARRVPLGDADPVPEPTGNMSSLEIVRVLVAAGADPNARLTGTGIVNRGAVVLGPTALLGAVQTGDVELAKTLVEVGADPLAKDNLGRTAVMLAGSRTGEAQEVNRLIDLLLGWGVDIDAVDRNGETAMHAAAYRDRPEMIELLAKRGASVDVWNRPNRHGSTPLLIAAGYRGTASFRPQPRAEAAIRAVMADKGIDPPAVAAPTAEPARAGY